MSFSKFFIYTSLTTIDKKKHTENNRPTKQKMFVIKWPRLQMITMSIVKHVCDPRTEKSKVGGW